MPRPVKESPPPKGLPTEASSLMDEDTDADELDSEVEIESAGLPRRSSTATSLRSWAIVLVPILAITLCGSQEPWTLALITGLIGLSCIILPARSTPPWLAYLPILLSLLCCLGAFLPVSLTGKPLWRQSMEADFGIPLGTMNSYQPWVSLECWMLLGVGVIWLGYCLGRGFGERERRQVLQRFVLLSSAICLYAAILQLRGLSMPKLWIGEWAMPYFGPFPNRNHFSTLAVVCTVLAFATAYDALRRQRASWLLYCAAAIPSFAVVVLNTSRAGVVLLFVGLGSWMLTATFRKGSMRRIAISVSVLLMATALLLVYGKTIVNRFTEGGSLASTVAMDGRLQIYNETLGLAEQHSLLGIGLGNFNDVFNAVRESTDYFARSRHPESSWLWFMTENGIPAFLLALFGFVVLLFLFKLKTSSGSRGRKDKRLRNAAAIGVILIALHSIMDTPMHGIGIATSAALLAGLALRPRKSTPALHTMSPIPSMVAGLLCLTASVLWLSLAAGRPLIPSESLAKQYIRAANQHTGNGDNASALEELNQAIAIQPLRWLWYSTRAELKLRLGYPALSALTDFNRARRLEPALSRVCEDEAQIWLRYQPELAVPAWREAIQRDYSRSQYIYENALGNSNVYPAIRPAVRALAEGDPKLQLMFLLNCIGDEFKKELAIFLSQYPTLSNFTPVERTNLFRRWLLVGDRDSLMKRFEAQPDWRRSSWSVIAEMHALDGNYKDAYELARDNIQPPYIPPASGKVPLSTARLHFLQNPQDTARGLELYSMQKEQGLTDDALSTLNTLSETPNPSSLLLYEKAAIYARKQEYTKAWEQIRLYLQAANLAGT